MASSAYSGPPNIPVTITGDLTKSTNYQGSNVVGAVGLAISATTATTATNLDILYGRIKGSSAFLQNEFTYSNATTAKPFVHMNIGDSLGDNKFANSDYENYYKQKFTLLGDFFNANGFTSSDGGTLNTSDYTNFVSGYTFTLPASSTATFTGGPSSGYWGQVIQVGYVTRTNFGTLWVSVTNPVTHASSYLTNVSSQSVYPGFGLCTVLAPSNSLWEVQVHASNNAVTLVGCAVLINLDFGAETVDFSHPGQSWSDFTNCPASILTNIAQAFMPQLLTVEEINADWTTNNQAAMVLNPLENTASNCDLVCLSPAPTIAGGTNELAYVAGEQKNFVLTNQTPGNFIFFNQAALWGTRAQGEALGFQSTTESDPHPTDYGRISQIQNMFNGLGLERIFENHTLSLKINYHNGDVVPSWTMINLPQNGTSSLPLRAILQGDAYKQFIYEDAAGNIQGSLTYYSGIINIGGHDGATLMSWNAAADLGTTNPGYIYIGANDGVNGIIAGPPYLGLGTPGEIDAARIYVTNLAIAPPSGAYAGQFLKETNSSTGQGTWSGLSSTNFSAISIVGGVTNLTWFAPNITGSRAQVTVGGEIQINTISGGAAIKLSVIFTDRSSVLQTNDITVPLYQVGTIPLPDMTFLIRQASTVYVVCSVVTNTGAINYDIGNWASER